MPIADINAVETTPSFPAPDASFSEDGRNTTQLNRSPTTYSKCPDDGCPSDCNEREIGNQSLAEQTLERRLRNAMVNSASRNSDQKSFIPLSDLNAIINVKTIHAELAKSDVGQNEDLQYRTNQICGIGEGGSTKTSRRCLFAILVLMCEASVIIKVIDEGLHDEDLPLALDTSRPGYPQLVRRVSEGKPNPVGFSHGWATSHIEVFFQYQWQVLSPPFKLRTEVGQRICHYPFEPSRILPITTISGPDRCGGFGTVSKIQIHPAHRNSPSSGSESWLALKRLHYSGEPAFRAEVDPLKRLGKDHPHLIQLLATYQHGENYYLLFPWADGGNLDDFYKSYPRADCPPRGPKLAKWLASQLSGLCDALGSIHHCDLDLSAANMSGFNSEEARKKYGTHGDLKSENILWFKRNGAVDEDEACSLGTFQISDFGLASFHKLESCQQFRPKGISATYRAPEYDIMGCVSQQYDMWSLGCVLTELATWYLLGGDAVAKFKKERSDDSQSRRKGDAFFNLTDDPDYHPNGRATSKKSVREHFKTLREQPGCTDFLLDFINFVEGQLLRICPQNRCQMPDLLLFTKKMGQECHEDSDYWEKLTKNPKVRQGTNLSEMVSGSTSRSNNPGNVGATHQRIMQQLNSPGSKDHMSAKPSLEIWPREIAGPESTIRGARAPEVSQPHEEVNDQHDAGLFPTPAFGNAKYNGGRSSREKVLNVLASTSSQNLPARRSSVFQIDGDTTRGSEASLGEKFEATQDDLREEAFHQSSNKPVVGVVNEVAKRESYGGSKKSLSLGCIRAKMLGWWARLRK
ncbi:putative serine threonine protein kinase [Rosellinia necatrix]|uniref:Putative serine threonine protein kinase n=1 Tax=Rosellinia necatrix TaxID=77044 RepID=A0A1W2TGX0_ROSNE|nr:putative serine threonine protein kinase [Rosellinia necatrix]